MKYKIVLLMLASVVFLPALLVGDDLADLQAAFQQAHKLATSNDPKDTDAYVALFHPEALGFATDDPILQDMKGVSKDQFKAVREMEQKQVEFGGMNVRKPEFRVFGSTGVVTAYPQVWIKLKDGPVKATYLRMTLVFAKLSGKWEVVSWHMSYFPVGN